jgi:hypothetical protein
VFPGIRKYAGPAGRRAAFATRRRTAGRAKLLYEQNSRAVACGTTDGNSLPGSKLRLAIAFGFIGSFLARSCQQPMFRSAHPLPTKGTCFLRAAISAMRDLMREVLNWRDRYPGPVDKQEPQ